MPRIALSADRERSDSAAAHNAPHDAMPYAAAQHGGSALPKRLRPLSGLDAGFLYLEAAGTPMHVGSVMLIEPPKRRGYDFHRDLLAHLAERLPRAPALRRILQPAPLDLGHPMWREVEEIDLDAHVLKRTLPRPGSEKQLAALVAKLHAQMLDRAHPLWQFVVIEGLASGHVALYSKIHHAVLDGQGGIALAQALLDLTPTRPAKRRKAAAGETATGPDRGDVARVALRANVQQLVKLLRAVPPVLKLASEPGVEGGGRLQGLRAGIGRLRDSVLIAPRTVFNRQVCEQRSFAAASLPLDQVKQVARAHGVSLNDIVMALCAGALRRHLQKRRALPAQPLIAAMPVSLRAAGDGESNNQVSMVQCPLPTDLDDPLLRLHTIAAATAGIKQRVAAVRGLIPTDFPGLAAPLWASGLSRLWARGRVAERLPPLANLAISNVPGPPVPLYLAGARVAQYYPVSIVTHGLALNITVQSYAGMLEFGITACRDALPDPAALARGLSIALDELQGTQPA
jgi:diacylglycerol O-acyltransferase